MWRISGVIDGVLVNALVEMVPEMAIRLLSRTTVETVVQLSKGNISSQNVRVEFSLEDMDMSRFQQGATYEQIQEWVQEKYGFHVTHLNIAKTKRKCGITERINYNLPKSENSKSPGTPKEKEEAIIDAFRHFQMGSFDILLKMMKFKSFQMLPDRCSGQRSGILMLMQLKG